MAKRKTKAQREQEQRDALFRRIADIYAGACGASRDDPDKHGFIGVDELGRAICAVRDLFGEPMMNWWGWQAHCLEYWTDPRKAADWLYDQDFRADEVRKMPQGGA